MNWKHDCHIIIKYHRFLGASDVVPTLKCHAAAATVLRDCTSLFIPMGNFGCRWPRCVPGVPVFPLAKALKAHPFEAAQLAPEVTDGGCSCDG